jgi:hypothetical protein
MAPTGSHIGKMVLIFTGYQKEMEALFSYDPVAEVLTHLGHMLKMKSLRAGTVGMEKCCLLCADTA